MRFKGHRTIAGKPEGLGAGNDMVLCTHLVIIVGAIAVEHLGAYRRRKLLTEESPVKGDLDGILGILVGDGEHIAAAGIVHAEYGVDHVDGVIFILESV